jgi:hypothetical protein
MFLLPAIIALGVGPVTAINHDGTQKIRLPAVWVLVFLGLVVLVGFRFEVGGDWYNYFRYLWRGSLLTYSDLVNVDDPGYMALNILSSSMGWGMTGVHVMGGFLFAFGTVVFVRSLPRPWLALACAVPYLIIVVGMGYTRQGIALGLVLVALTALRRQSYQKFVVLVALGALFHKSAVLVIPVAALTVDRIRIQTVGLIGLATFGAYDALLSDHAARLVNVYVDRQLTESQGAFIRLSMNAAPAGLLLYYRRGFARIMAPTDYRIWRAMAWLSIAMFVALLSSGFSTALDRMALYLIPIQLAVFSYLPDVVGKRNGRNTAIVGLILFYYGVVLFVWLNFATHSQYWIPYQIGLSLN